MSENMPLDLTALRAIQHSPTSSPWAEIEHADFGALLDRVEAAEASMDRARVEVMAGEHAESCARRYAWAPDNCTCWKNAMLTALGWSNQ